ncbi:MAG: thioesterase family protein [Planctomycetota bacterium]
MSVGFKTRRMVQFVDTDMAGIAHFTNYLRYLEEAEHEFLRSVDLSVVMYDDRGSYGFPKMSVQCDYKQPVRHEQWLDIELEISTDDDKSIDYRGQFFLDGKLVAKGAIKVACCRFPPNDFPYPIPIPDHILKVLKPEMSSTS